MATQLMRVVSAAICFSSLTRVIIGARLSTASFEEYDHTVLDSYSFFGSPYGGYGRSTRSAISSLPFRLPNVGSSEPSDDPFYMKIRDGDGVLHACRVYHEDELDPNSLGASMFDPPVLRRTTDIAVKESDSEADVIDDEIAILLERDLSKKLTEEDIDLLTDETLDRLEQLDGICGQIHKGWWSYEWCHEGSASQFHIAVDEDTSSVSVEDLTKLGTSTDQDIIVDLANQPPNEEAEDVPELARVVYSHKYGDICEETEKPRASSVEMKCCSPRVMERQASLLHRNLLPVKEKIASVVDIYEDEDEICTYNITICTPLLCGVFPEKEVKRYVDENGVSTETVRGLLNRVLGNDCLPSHGGGWWTYEICHGDRISQFHEEMGYVVNKETNTRVAKKIIDDQYNLGEYDADDVEHYPDEEEHLHVVNATASSNSDGTYFEMEYTGGDGCDGDKDVKDAAIVGGSRGSSGIKRASTVRYFCGPEAKMTVNEDRTCHYMVRVFVPELCLHPLFKAPVSKKQIVKCLPVEDKFYV